jgi:hypothetical protein
LGGGIKTGIMAIGLDEEKISSDLINFNISTIEPAGTKILDFHLNDYPICVDISAKNFFRDKTSFYYDKKIRYLDKHRNNKLIKARMFVLYAIIFELSGNF